MDDGKSVNMPDLALRTDEKSASPKNKRERECFACWPGSSCPPNCARAEVLKKRDESDAETAQLRKDLRNLMVWSNRHEEDILKRIGSREGDAKRAVGILATHVIDQ
jgi:hypothetical protein